ncbi:MAG: phosphatase PAP2 family protein [Deltaproteobacteria bacterium]|jgi:undecaprenyl-diphosphatase|nr:phosphatase PAP2 family protein [Deltaproteobacteria bacterium]
MVDALAQWDKELFYALNGFRAPALDALMPVFSWTWLLWAFSLLLFGIWLVHLLLQKRGRRRMGELFLGVAFVIITAGTTEVVTIAVKEEARRMRPYHTLPLAHFYTNSGWERNPDALPQGSRRTDSFFSGHAAHSMAAAVCMSVLLPPLSPVIFAVPVVVGYSRIYLGKHYPGDVFAGWLAGAFVALAVRRAMRRFPGRTALPDKGPDRTPDRTADRPSRASFFVSGRKRGATPYL